MITLKKAQYEKLMAPKGKSEQTLKAMQDKEIARMWVEQNELLVRIQKMEDKMTELGKRIDQIGGRKVLAARNETEKIGQ